MSFDPVIGVEFRLIACAMRARIGLLQPRDFAGLAADALIHCADDAELCRAVGEFWRQSLADQIAAGVAAQEFLMRRGSPAADASDHEIAEQVLIWHRKDTYG